MSQEQLLSCLRERLKILFERDTEVALYLRYGDDPYWPNYARGKISAHQSEIQWIKQLIQRIEEQGLT